MDVNGIIGRRQSFGVIQGDLILHEGKGHIRLHISGQ